MKTCKNCGERAYALGCVNCDEEAYMEAAEVRAQIALDELLNAPCGRCGSPDCFGGCELATLEQPPSADAVDRHVSSTGTLTPRDKGI